MYKVALRHAEKLVTPAQLSVLKLALSLHLYSPKVQMFGQIAQERKLPVCETIADIAGQLTCDVIQLVGIIKKVSALICNFFKFECFNLEKMNIYI